MSETVANTGHARARAGANFALIKYWGKRDTALNLPDVGSISITLEALHTETAVRLDPSLIEDRFELDGRSDPKAAARVVALLERLRTMTGSRCFAEVRSVNNFPTGAGLASSASGFAALVEAATAAYGLELAGAERSVLARIGSGSAARSIFGGFVEMARGQREDGADAVASMLAPPEHWALQTVIAVSDRGRKSVGSTEGMNRTAQTSPFYRGWVEHQEADLAAMRAAILARDFEATADLAEASALTMHGLAMSARPGLIYFNASTIECLHRVRALRAAGIPVFFTVDAGPQVKAICLPEAVEAVAEALAQVPGVTAILRSGLGPGATRLD